MEKFVVGPRPPLFFLHIPKTAGTSMRRFLADQYLSSEVCPANEWEALARIPSEELGRFRLVQGHYAANLQQLIAPDAKILTLLRDPLNRTLSTIRHLRRDPNFHPLHHRAKDMSILEILRDPVLFQMHRNAQTALLSATGDVRDIIDYFRAGSQQGQRRDPGEFLSSPDLAIAKEQLARFDFVGLCEELDQFLPYFFSEMGYHPAIFFPYVNDAPDGASDFRNLSPPEIELLRQCNDLDLELYAYARSLVAQRAERWRGLDLSPRRAVARLCERGIYRVCDRSFEIDIALPIPGSGWYEPEFDGARMIRWTGPFNRFSLELPLVPGGHFHAKLRFISPEPIEANEFHVTANGLDLPLEMAVNRRTYECAFDIRPSVTEMEGGFCQLLFELPSVSRPTESGSTDVRKLGILLLDLAFERLDHTGDEPPEAEGTVFVGFDGDSNASRQKIGS